MTTGSINKQTDGPNGWTRDWTGGDGTKGHHNVDHPYSVTWARYNSVKGYYPRCGLNPAYYVNAGFLATPFPNGDLAALNRLSQAIKGHSFNAGTFLATSPQMIRQTLSTLRAVGGALIDLRHGNLIGALQNLGMSPGQRLTKHMHRKLNSGDISGTWLAMQYGWLPTLSDLYDAASAFSTLNSKEHKYSFRSSFRNRVGRTDTIAGAVPYLNRKSGERSVHYKYTLTELPSVGRSLGLTDPASMLWEILPWSFVVDWFIPIGTYFETANLLGAVTGHWVKSDIERRDTKAGPAYCGSQAHHHLAFLTRTVGDGSLSVPLPHYNGNTPFNLSGKRILNAISLIHQRLV